MCTPTAPVFVVSARRWIFPFSLPASILRVPLCPLGGARPPLRACGPPQTSSLHRQPPVCPCVPCHRPRSCTHRDRRGVWAASARIATLCAKRWRLPGIAGEHLHPSAHVGTCQSVPHRLNGRRHTHDRGGATVTPATKFFTRGEWVGSSTHSGSGDRQVLQMAQNRTPLSPLDPIS